MEIVEKARAGVLLRTCINVRKQSLSLLVRDAMYEGNCP